MNHTINQLEQLRAVYPKEVEMGQPTLAVFKHGPDWCRFKVDLRHPISTTVEIKSSTENIDSDVQNV